AIYGGEESAQDKLAAKAIALERMRAEYRSLREAWGGFAGYDRWFERPLGNAHLASIGAYTDLLPGFRRLLSAKDDDLLAFYAEVGRLAELPAAARRDALGESAVIQAAASRPAALPAAAPAPRWAAGTGHERLSTKAQAARGQ